MLNSKDNNTIVLKEFENTLNNVAAQINVTNQNYFAKFKEIIDKEMRLVNLNFSVLNYKNNDYSSIILSLCYKNLISILSTIELIKKGYLGSSKIIFRNIYEGLVIGKYIGITNDNKLYNKWQNGEQISLNQNIFKKILMPLSKESVEFWDVLNKYNHSTIYSQNFMLEIDMKEITNCNVIITVLLAMNNHLLNAFVSNYYNYYLKRYFDPSYISLKKELSKDLSLISKNIDLRCKKVIKEYLSNWDILI